MTQNHPKQDVFFINSILKEGTQCIFNLEPELLKCLTTGARPFTIVPLLMLISRYFLTISTDEPQFLKLLSVQINVS